MNILSFFGAFSFCFAIFQGVYVLAQDARAAANRLFFGITICIALWSLAAAFGYSASERTDVFMWVRVSTFGYVFLHTFTLHFCVNLARGGRPHHPLFYLIYLPSLFFLYRGHTDILIFSDFIREGSFWIGVPAFELPLFYIFMANYLVYYITAIVILLRWRSRTDSRREKKQALLVALSITFTILLYNLEPYVLPLFTPYRSLVISPNMGIVWITGLWIAITRYRFLSFTPEFVSREIFEQVDRSIFLLGKDRRIVAVNRAGAALLDMSTSLLQGKPFDHFTPEVQKLDLRLDRLEKGGSSALSTALVMNGRNGATVMMRYHLSLLRDRFGDLMGFLLIGREAQSLERMKSEFSLTGRELDVLRHLVAGRTGKEIATLCSITLRTVKAHVAGIYYKLGIENRVQLMRLIRRFDTTE
ncbi:MAG: PAS domain-containing protein [Spirochaetes bacterium]|nr:PAS domain-containing protein [Spirochaetota bacterium]